MRKFNDRFPYKRIIFVILVILLTGLALILSGCQTVEFLQWCADPAMREHGPFCPKDRK